MIERDVDIQTAAAEFPERIRASASLHGIRLCTDAADSPHRRADRIRGETCFGCALFRRNLAGQGG